MNRSLLQEKKAGVYKAIVFIFMLSLAGSQAFAQKGFEFGVRYMVQKSWLKNSSDKDAAPQLVQESTWSYLNGGLGITYNFSSMIGVELDILHSRQGQSYSGNTPIINVNTPAYTRNVVLLGVLNSDALIGEYQAKAELNCLKIPLLLKLSTDNSRMLYFHLAVGPQINMVQSVVYELNKEDVELPGINITPDDVYKKTTIDGVVSLGAGLNITRHLGVTADLRFDHGFSDVEKKDASYSYGGNNIKYYAPDRGTTNNATLGAMIGINYKL